MAGEGKQPYEKPERRTSTTPIKGEPSVRVKNELDAAKAAAPKEKRGAVKK